MLFAVTTNIAFSDSFGDAADIILTTAVPPGLHPLDGQLVTAISGSVFSAGVSSTITGLESPGTFGNDNLLFIDAPFFDLNGIAFDLNLGFGTLPFLLSSAGLSVCFDSGCMEVISSDKLRLEIAPTPLPAALPLFASGGVLLGFVGWRRKGKLASR
jgi:hypothetical protein